jgi:hypothetical protein
MAMEGDKEIVGDRRVKVGGKKLHDTLRRAVAVGLEREIDRLGGAGRREEGEHEQQNRCRERLS